MRVLILVPELDKPGGISTYYASLRPHMSSEIEYFTRGFRKQDTLFFGILTTIRDWFMFLLRLLRTRYDVIHINTSLGLKGCLRDGVFILVAKIFRLPVIVFFRGWNDSFAQELRGFPMVALRMTFLRCDAIMVLAEDFKKTIEKWGFPGNIYLETTTVDDALLLDVTEDGLVKKHSVKRKTFNILFLANVSETKGVYETIDAYQIVRAKYPETALTVAGVGPAKSDAERLVRERHLEGVRFSGYLIGDKKARAFAEADLYCLPTRHAEGMPNSVLEAMAFGLPVLTRPIGGLKDFFQHGEMGFLTESVDPKVYAELIEQLIEDTDLRKTIALYNHRFAVERFAASKVAQRLTRIYAEVIGDTAE